MNISGHAFQRMLERGLRSHKGEIDYYEQHDFDKDFKDAEKEGRVFWVRGCTIENVMDKIREQRGIKRKTGRI